MPKKEQIDKIEKNLVITKNVCMNPPSWYSKKCFEQCWNYKLCTSYLKSNYSNKKIKKEN